jgi:hypothetical protein
VNNDETHNLSELMEFLQTNREKTLDERTLQYRFNALVTYYHSSKAITFNSEARVETGFDSGKIILKENEQCPAEKFHLDFKPKWQTMYFNRESNILEINGSSSKMGSYKVSISALEKLKG